MWSMIALSPKGSSGLGVVAVRGRSLWPLPPAMLTASTGTYDFCIFRFTASTICPSLSTTGISSIALARKVASSLTETDPALSVCTDLLAMADTGLSSVRPETRCRRMSPSVIDPDSRPSESTANSVCDRSDPNVLRRRNAVSTSVVAGIIYRLRSCLVIFQSVLPLRNLGRL